ncbi:MAG: Fic family protein, partial [Helicobacteraceae bacterium]|nr:Fic family protein [Helicobacteraceae bacterium]
MDNKARKDFDLAHLKETHRYFFQDLPLVGVSEVTPGKFRPTVPVNLDWIKNRNLKSVNLLTFVAYSRMDKEAQNKLDSTLKQVDINALTKLDLKAFTQAIGDLYAQVDFIHPFADGNSRTLRQFTRELANACGYDIQWERFNANKAGRDILYIARDLSVNTLALPYVKSADVKRDLLYTMDTLEGNRDL